MNMDTITRSVEAPVTEVNKKTGVVRAIVSDDSNDRFNTVFDPEGCSLEGWQRAARWCATTTGKHPAGSFQ